jgi:hypothetical protein
MRQFNHQTWQRFTMRISFDVPIRKWWFGLVVACVVAGGCASDKPKQSDVDRAALVVYPGATIETESWHDAIDVDYIDTGGLHEPAALIASWAMTQTATAEQVLTTISEELVAMGWISDPKYTSVNSLRFVRTLQGNRDILDLDVKVGLDVPNGSDRSKSIALSYTIVYLP